MVRSRVHSMRCALGAGISLFFLDAHYDFSIAQRLSFIFHITNSTCCFGIDRTLQFPCMGTGGGHCILHLRYRWEDPQHRRTLSEFLPCLELHHSLMPHSTITALSCDFCIAGFHHFVVTFTTAIIRATHLKGSYFLQT